jgi:hypothetical protein
MNTSNQHPIDSLKLKVMV